MRELLTEDAVRAALTDLDGWRHDRNSLVRTAELGGFPQAIAVVDRVAEIAERDNHHPDIDIRWRTLTFRCSTHDAGGITAADIRLAGAINEAIAAG